MPTAESGFVTAITGVLSGLIIEVMLKSFVDAGLLSQSTILVYQLANIATIIAFVHATRYWGTLYLFGWWFGSGIMLYSGLLGGPEFAFYSIVLILVLASRIKRGFE
jgi:uncharacterized membrane protein YgdD (TMEM256/DUF423 family)